MDTTHGLDRRTHRRASGWQLHALLGILSIYAAACAAPDGAEPAPAGEVLPAPAEAADEVLRAKLRGELDAILQSEGTSFAALWAELEPLLVLPEGSERDVRLKAYEAKHGARVRRAGRLMAGVPGSEAARLAATEQSATTAIDRLAQTRTCISTFEHHPRPPYHSATTWGGGRADAAAGAFSWSSASTAAFGSRDGVQFRSDHVPFRSAETTVFAQYNVHAFGLAVLTWLGGWAYADFNTRIWIADERGATVKDCGKEVAHHLWAAWFGTTHNGAAILHRSCSYPAIAFRTFSARVEIEGHTVGWIGQANSDGRGVLERVSAVTCF